MGKVLLWMGVAAASLSAGTALAQPARTIPGYYGQLSLGAGVAGSTTLSLAGVGSGDEDLDTGFFASAAFGKSLDGGVAIESELLYLKNEINTEDVDAALGTDLNASVQTLGIMVNAHYAALPIGPFTGSIGAGVGYGGARYKVAGSSESKQGFMWQAMAGLSYPVTERLSWDLQYRYIRSPDFQETVDVGGVSYSVKIETGAHVVAVGARMKFF